MEDVALGIQVPKNQKPRRRRNLIVKTHKNISRVKKKKRQDLSKSSTASPTNPLQPMGQISASTS